MKTVHAQIPEAECFSSTEVERTAAREMRASRASEAFSSPPPRWEVQHVSFHKAAGGALSIGEVTARVVSFFRGSQLHKPEALKCTEGVGALVKCGRMAGAMGDRKHGQR